MQNIVLKINIFLTIDSSYKDRQAYLNPRGNISTFKEL